MSSNSGWDELYGHASEGVEEWPRRHPKATFLEIATEVDEQLSRVRARMLEDVAMRSEAARAGAVAECTRCGRGVRTQGGHRRKLLTEHDEQVELTRSYARCPSCGERFSPLDEQLQLAPGALAPDLCEHLARLSARIPFEQAVEDLYLSHRCRACEPTARRLTLSAGEAWVDLETAEAERIERELPQPPQGPLSQ